MRARFLLALACLSCGKTALPGRAADAAADAPPSGGADASHTPVPDAFLAPDEVESRPDLAFTPDLAPPSPDSTTSPDLPSPSPDLAAGPDYSSDGAAGCTPLPIAWLPLEALPYCPPSSEPAACAGNDVGAVVARSEACVDAWGAILFQCVVWDRLADDLELVVLEVPNCLDSITIDSALACADRIELAYTINGACEDCDGKHPIWRALLLPRDPRPVIATGRTSIPPCPPPPPNTGGTTGSGGVSGTGGRTSSGGTGGGTAIDGGCPQTPVDPTQAAAAYAAHIGLSPAGRAEAEEKTVPSLWEEMHAQLFDAKRYYDGGSPTTACSFIYRECAVTMLTDSCNMFGPITSGVATQGAFYYSWGSGSGIYRTNFGKLAPSGATLVKTTSGGYTNDGYGPPPLVIALDAGRILVYRPAGVPTDFNQWQGGELIGTLKDFGDRLAIVDGNGQEIPAEFPSF